MSLFFRIIEKSDFEELQDFEQKKIKETLISEIELSFALWESPTRPESMDYYIKSGWSFLIRNKDIPSLFSKEGLLVGYFLAQPLLFLDNQPQSLWVEHISFSSLETRDRICELAYQLGKEKHFQKVYFPNINSVLNSVKNLKPSSWSPNTLQVHTTKVSL
jgi:RNA recognition motif-containing protein